MIDEEGEALREWDRREVCPDGACVGVIGPDGLCKVCGRAAPNWGDERQRGMITPEPQEVVPSEEPSAEPAPGDDTQDYEWSRRRLCPDGACIGVLGPDNKCTVCGRSAE